MASNKEAREIYRIGVQYNSIEETLLANGMAPNRKAGQRAFHSVFMKLHLPKNRMEMNRKVG